MFQSLGRTKAEAAWCPRCGARGEQVRREVATFYKVRSPGAPGFLDRTAAQIGIPRYDILIARNQKTGRAVGLELSWDAENVLGPLWDGAGLEWS